MMGEFIRAKNVKRRRKSDRWVAQGSSHSAPLKSNTPLAREPTPPGSTPDLAILLIDIDLLSAAPCSERGGDVKK